MTETIQLTKVSGKWTGELPEGVDPWDILFDLLEQKDQPTETKPTPTKKRKTKDKQ